MNTSDVESYYGSLKKAADALKISKSAVYAWGELVPPLSAARLQQLSRGVLVFDPSRYKDYYTRNRNKSNKIDAGDAA